ncbi:DUF397 domain-containing protein [Streptomyces tsukubensis]|uniref:DUF397 domain-containing protein n=1 Tax=Streptomyces tsukubensis TaxID=83656 RepID=A0A1V4AB79_9ACTN|nr:DUF397 domain-containing protein [Streptomyces tsukubensis]OON81098.1 DUF397 domain-containing protein [Streptomyces tsukubensis]QFR94934.1 DUF397 domain-containing protein [Streptomyces tsukubensis]
MRATEALSTTQWRKSSYSGQEEGEACVEIADGVTGLIPVRDSKTPLAPNLAFTRNAWSTFVGSLKNDSTPTV